MTGDLPAPSTPAMPQFAHRDPSQAAFWDERFAHAFMPWDAAGVPRALREFVAADSAPRATLIPGCGAAYEAAWLDAQGWPVRAIDFSPVAVESAKAQLGPRAGLVEQADFFTYTPAFALDMIYERAFLCALPRNLWQDYAGRMAQLLPSGGCLAGYFFLKETPKGPPFGIAREALDALLTPGFVCEDDRLVDDSVPVFAGAEHWMVWRRR
ncbi:thiopurine S-methyltransferase [Pandoraea faecigallinarum]|uniref:Thiopurine S-methyltransferase n=1 Tax=Pandoraea faecigallinarum TaxID=656179 RepID=A0A0H3WZ21_9BURK|nr:methyltransferase domain-containing protein [Pandoraea faecigallinarum]AKM32890.1 thiopurine S-methyltransferase [Pandoraea faecigallinarum]